VTDYNPLGDELEEPASHNRRVALIISVLALLLTLADIMGQSAQTRALQSNIEASNIWSFYQAKHMRETALKIAADEMETDLIGVSDEQRRNAMQQRIAEWRATASRYESDPATNEGRKELTARAKDTERLRDEAEQKHRRYELAKGSFQIGIVVASASIITEVWPLLWVTWVLGGLGLLFFFLGLVI
jgi:Domain of unknown function (DUF4337)